MLTISQKKLLSIIVFFASYSYLLVFMHQFLGGAHLNFVPFWIAVLGILVPVVYLTRANNLNNLTKSAIFAEIILIILFLNLCQIMLRHYQLTISGDAYLILVSANRIQATSHCLTAVGPTIDKFPLLQVFSLAISETSSISMYSIALFSPVFYQILAVGFMYLFARELYNERIALLACAIFAPYVLLAQYNSNFRPEVLAYIFLFACLFLFVRKGMTYPSPSTHALVILFAVSITLTHYTTNTIFVIFLIVMLTVFVFSQLLNSKTNLGKEARLNPSLVFMILVIVVTLAYWVYIGTGLVELLLQEVVVKPLANAALSIEELRYLPRVAMLKDVVVLRTNAGYVLLFAGLMLYEILRRRRCQNWLTDFSLACWAGCTFVLWLIGEIHPEYLASSRIYLFSYPFILILVSHIVIELSSAWKRISLVVLLVGFALLNILSIEIIPLNPLSHASPFPLSNWDTTQEVQAASWQGVDAGFALTSGAMGSLLQYTKGLGPSSIGQTIDYFEGDIESWRKNSIGSMPLSWLYLKPDDPAFVRIAEFTRVTIRLDEAMLIRLSDTPWLQKVYTNGEWVIYRIRQF